MENYRTLGKFRIIPLLALDHDVSVLQGFTQSIIRYVSSLIRSSHRVDVLSPVPKDILHLRLIVMRKDGIQSVGDRQQLIGIRQSCPDHSQFHLHLGVLIANLGRLTTLHLVQQLIGQNLGMINTTSRLHPRSPPRKAR